MRSLEDRLCDAVWEGDLDLVKDLITLGADIECFKSDGNDTPLHLAVEQNDLPIVEVLLQAGADVNRRTKDGFWTPLLHAVDLTSCALTENVPVTHDVISLLLSWGANVNDRIVSSDRATNGQSALQIAATYLDWEAERLLKAAGAKG